jgi:hypothetical protein
MKIKYYINENKNSEPLPFGYHKYFTKIVKSIISEDLSNDERFSNNAFKT